jgi:hypothetical protein
MTRLAAGILLAVLVAFPLAVRSTPPITWLAALALGVGGAGVVALAVPVVTAGASIALIAYALALVIARPAADPLAALAFGATLVLLPVVVHFAGRVQGAAIGTGVVAAQLHHWLAIAAAGVGAGLALTVAGAALAPALLGATLPLAVAAAALGVLLAAASVITLVASRE